MSKPSIAKFRMPSKWVAAIAVLTVAVAGGAALFSASGTKNAQAMNHSANKSQPPVRAEQRGRIRASLDALPLAFEANQGQTDPQVKYTARGNGYSVFLTANDTVFAIGSAKRQAAPPSRIAGAHSLPLATEKMQSAAIDMRLVGGNLKPEIVAGNEVPGVINYYAGSDPKNWHTGVKQYSSVSYRDVYPGVNMVFHGAQRQLEFDFVVSPGADPKTIGLGFKGAQKLATDASGNLLLASSAGDVVLHKPVAYQEKDGKREIVEAAFQVRNGNEVGLNLGTYDRGQELVIDPSLSYSTYLGGTAEDDAYAIAIDGSGNAYVTGQTKSINFPKVTGAFQGTNAGSFDIFVSKIAANGSSLIYSTYIGGSGDDSGNAIAVDGSGNTYVAGGTTSSTDFPLQNANQTTFGGGSVDAFVLELASSGGSLTFSTYLGGSGDDVANGIAVDNTGVYVVGSTRSSDFPLQSAFQSSHGTSTAFVTKLTPGTPVALAYSTYLGGGTNDFASSVAVASGNAYVTGATTDSTFPVTATAFQSTCGTAANCNGGSQDAFVTVFNSTGSAPLVYSTFLGGQANDQGLGIAVDSSGNAYVTGLTQSSQFPVKSPLQSTFKGGTQDAFVAKLDPSASPAANTLVYSTFLGGTQSDAGSGIAVDGSGNAYVTGGTSSSDFPTAAATQGTIGGMADAFVTQISASGSLVFSTFLGGALNENTNGGNPLNPVGAIAVDSAGANIYVAGNTASSPFPVITGSLQTTLGGGTDAFVAKYSTGSSSGSFTVSNGALSNTSGHAGVSATATITVGSTGGFNAAVALACTVSPVVTKGPTCNFSNPSVTPPANSTTTSTLNVGTTAASALLTRPANGWRSGAVYALLLPVFGLTFLGAAARPSGARRRKFVGLVVLGIVLMCLLLLPACGSSKSGGGGGGTPTGTYTITVTGTNGGTVVTGTPALTLTIN
ncbi:MAG TPA: SBBP repeat-containing protein [Candidatus Sulfotelmatobacter sp.]|nr:SBBP repeat-containing protein [Candidatus Sulfotelmatobacter sp.]